MNIGKKHTVFFRKTSMAALIAVYFLILVGGIVRSTGAGMGCPDWPKCFGSWIPPTSESELSETYKEDFVEYRKGKNQRFASYLHALGFDRKASQVLNDQSVLTETDFNATKTWTEYINRLIGAIIGLLILLNFGAAIPYYRRDKLLFMLSLLLVVLVVFQGWIGSVVVSTNLLPWMVTVHMLLAMMILALLIFLVFRIRSRQYVSYTVPKSKMLNILLVLSGILVVTQILFGTQVREAIDGVSLSLNFQDRDSWIELTGLPFLVHRSFSILLLLSQTAILYILFKNRKAEGSLPGYATSVMALLVVETLTGIVMAYFGIPPFAQPMHLLVAMIIFGIQFMMILIINARENEVGLNAQITR